MRILLLLPALLAIGACDFGVFKDCTLEVRMGILVTVIDSVSAEAIAEPITAVATDGAYADTASVPAGFGSVAVVRDRPGTYHLEVTAPGYGPWVRDGVRVRMDDDGCHVRQTELTALMQPLDAGAARLPAAAAGSLR